MIGIGDHELAERYAQRRHVIVLLSEQRIGEAAALNAPCYLDPLSGNNGVSEGLLDLFSDSLICGSDFALGPCVLRGASGSVR